MVEIAFLLLLSVQFVLVSACDNGWLEFKNLCYRFDERGYTVTEATVSCRHANAQLPEINSTELNQWLLQQMNNRSIDSIWTGALNLLAANVWVWVPSANPFIRYLNWDQGEPNNNKPDKCVMFNSTQPNKWKSKDCNNYNSYICEKPKNGSSCELNFRSFGRKCYLFGNRTVVWWHAEGLCIREGAGLAEIETGELNAWLGEQVATITLKKSVNEWTAAPANERYWTGNFWIGGSNEYTEGRKWEWVTSHNRMMPFVNWMQGEPENITTEKCMLMGNATTDGQWYNEPCTNIRSPFVCEKAISENSYWGYGG